MILTDKFVEEVQVLDKLTDESINNIQLKRMRK